MQAIEAHAVLKWFFYSLLGELRQNLVRTPFHAHAPLLVGRYTAWGKQDDGEGIYYLAHFTARFSPSCDEHVIDS